MKKTACVLFRTHCWNETVEFNFKFLRKNTTFDIFILLNDENNNLSIKFSNLDCEIISTKLCNFKERGFPIHPKGLWYTGDYQMIDALLSKDYDYALMVEFDCFINLNLDDIINKLIENKVDLSGKRIGLNSKNWYWNFCYKRWIEKISETAKITEDKIETIFKNGGIFFPFVWCSKKLGEKLYKKRVEQNKLCNSNSDFIDLLPFCEKFVVEECLLNKYKFVGLDELNFATFGLRPTKNPQKKHSISHLTYSSPNLNKSIFHPSLIKSDFTIKALEISELKDLKEFLKKIESTLLDDDAKDYFMNLAKIVNKLAL